MAKITPQSENFSKWYTDTILHTDLADYGPVKGTMVIKPYGFSLWSNVKKALNTMIEETISEEYLDPSLPPPESFTNTLRMVYERLFWTGDFWSVNFTTKNFNCHIIRENTTKKTFFLKTTV